MATTDISSDLTLGFSFECGDQILTVTDNTDYPTAGTSRADVKVNYAINYKKSTGDSAITLTYNEDTVTSFDVAVNSSGYHEIVMTVAQDTENVKSALTGTISVTSSDANVTGSGTLFTSELAAGDTIQIDGVLYVVGSVTNNTQLVLATAYAGATASGLTAYLVPVFTGTFTQPFWVACAYKECYNDNILALSRNYSCGCEPATVVLAVMELQALIAAAEYKFNTQQDFSGAQIIAEELDLYCAGNCCS